MQPLSSNENTQSWLSWFFRGLLILALLVMGTRLFELSVIKGAYYRDLSDNNRIRKVPIKAPRGKIYARGGQLLVDNEVVRKTVVFSPESGFEKKLADADTAEDEIITEHKRVYKLGADFAHVSGYLGEANEDEVNKVDPDCTEKGPITLGSFIGRSGLEQYYDCQLRGIDGEELVEVDTRGQRIRTLGFRPAVPGDDIRTNIDIDYQKKIAEIVNTNEEIPTERKATIVVSTPNGQVLALYSSPSFDPNLFLDSKRNNKEISNLLNDNRLPMFNRAIGGGYHPGSIFKIVTSIAALEEGAIEPDYTYEDKGIITVNEFSYTNWYFTQYGRVEGTIDLPKAIARSTDTFFYEVGDLLGIDKLVDWSKRFELDQKTNIDLSGEASGLVPSPEWKKAIKGERWFLGNTYHMSIGQGDLTTTPVSLHKMVASVSQNGKLCDLSIAGQSECRKINIDREHLQLVQKGMVGACSSGGTAFSFFEWNEKNEPELGQVACKTGTAETNEEDATHAWFSMYAPVDMPEIVITVLVEKGGGGSDVAAPLARELMDYWAVQKKP